MKELDEESRSECHEDTLCFWSTSQIIFIRAECPREYVYDVERRFVALERVFVRECLCTAKHTYPSKERSLLFQSLLPDYVLETKGKNDQSGICISTANETISELCLGIYGIIVTSVKLFVLTL